MIGFLRWGRLGQITFFFFFFPLGGKSLFLGADRRERRLEMGGDACPTF